MHHLQASTSCALYVGEWPAAERADVDRVISRIEAEGPWASEEGFGGPPWLCIRSRAGRGATYTASRLGVARQYRAATAEGLVRRLLVGAARAPGGRVRVAAW
jgi:hypothetical protein